MNNLKISKAVGNPNYKNTFLWEYESSFDCLEDWALVESGARNAWVIYLHGHGSDGTQLFTRQDVVDLRLNLLRKHEFSILAPNLRGNAWMCPAAVHDLHELIEKVKGKYNIENFVIFSGSMGGTGGLIYSVNHPEDIDAIIAGCPATDLSRYYKWCCEHDNPPVLSEIADAMEKAYGGTPDEIPEIYEKHSTYRNVEKLTMPLHLSHGNDDSIIPVEESRLLAEKLSGVNPDLTYDEIDGGNHDAPLTNDKIYIEWLTSLLGTI
jgi:pimeloyl-ACP methyl ester carboxylesterase